METIAGKFTREEIYSQPAAWTAALQVYRIGRLS